MSLRDDIQKEIAVAMKAGDKLKLSAVRMLLSAVKYKEVDAKRPLTDEEVHQVVGTLVRQRLDSIEQFKQGQRADLAQKEEAELAILRAYLPPQLSADELREIVKAAAARVGAAAMKDMGKLMKELMPAVKGKADGKLVSDIVKEVLGG